jgi:hypothetical protein
MGAPAGEALTADVLTARAEAETKAEGEARTATLARCRSKGLPTKPATADFSGTGVASAANEAEASGETISQRT